MTVRLCPIPSNPARNTGFLVCLLVLQAFTACSGFGFRGPVFQSALHQSYLSSYPLKAQYRFFYSPVNINELMALCFPRFYSGVPQITQNQVPMQQAYVHKEAGGMYPYSSFPQQVSSTLPANINSPHQSTSSQPRMTANWQGLFRPPTMNNQAQYSVSVPAPKQVPFNGYVTNKAPTVSSLDGMTNTNQKSKPGINSQPSREDETGVKASKTTQNFADQKGLLNLMGLTNNVIILFPSDYTSNHTIVPFEAAELLDMNRNQLTSAFYRKVAFH